MNRIERAAEDADPPSRQSRSCSVRRSLRRAARRPRRPAASDCSIRGSTGRQLRPCGFEQRRNAGAGDGGDRGRRAASSRSARALERRHARRHRRARRSCSRRRSAAWPPASGRNSSQLAPHACRDRRPDRVRVAPDTSTTWTSTFVRSRWRRNWWPRPRPAMRAFDQPGHVGDDEAAVVAQADDAEIRRQRRERVVGNLRAAPPRCARSASTCRRSGKPTRPTSASSFSSSRRSFLSPGSPGCTLRGARLVDVAKCALPMPPRPPLRDEHALVRLRRGRPAGAAARPGRRSSRRRACRSAPAARGRAPLWPVRFEPWPCSPRSAVELGMEAVVDEGVGVRAGDDVDRAAVAAVAAARAAARHELLAAERQASAAAVPAATWMSTSSTNMQESVMALIGSRSDHQCTDRDYSTGQDADDAAAGAVILEPHAAGDLREDRVVLAEAAFSPGRKRRPRWRTMIVPPVTRLPSCAFTPSRCELESRPLRELPCPFL